MPAPSARPLSRRVAAVFLAPRALSAELRLHAPWLGALLLVTAAAVTAAAFTPAEYLLERVRDPVDRLGRPVQVTSDAPTVVFWGRILQMFSAAAMQPMIVLALAGVLALLARYLLRGDAPFRHHMALAAHALLIPAAGALLLLPIPSGTPAYRVFTTVDPFTVWGLAVAGLGVATLHGAAAARPVALLVGGYLVAALGLAALPG
jgi:hypothetical protein